MIRLRIAEVSSPILMDIKSIIITMSDDSQDPINDEEVSEWIPTYIEKEAEHDVTVAVHEQQSHASRRLPIQWTRVICLNTYDEDEPHVYNI